MENEKTVIFVRGNNTSERVRDVMKDLVSRQCRLPLVPRPAGVCGSISYTSS